VISLVVATKGRVAEIGALFDSLEAQEPPFEVILVDQNGDGRLDALAAAWAPRMPLTHLRMAVANANAGRNLGLRHARGALVAFPDDDCLLKPGTLAQVRAAFAAPSLAVLTGPAEAPGGGLGSGRWRTEAGPITLANVWTSVIEFNLWLRRDVALELGGFDEQMGPGARFGSAEGNDLVCRALSAGHRAHYDPALRVVHPDKRLTPEAVERAGRYGLGLGFALRPVDLVGLVNAQVDEVQAAFPATVVERRLPAALRAEADPDRLAQLLGNLLSNARHHGLPGRPVAVALRAEGGDAVLQVRNQAPPIAEEQAGQLFSPYNRESLGQARNPGGLGLGLRAAAEIARGHGGDLSYAHDGRDVVFTARWPVQGPAPG